MSYEDIELTRDAGVAIIQMDRPQALNALNLNMMRELADALAKLENDDSVGCVILTGSEKAFAAGADIKEMSSLEYLEIYKTDLFYNHEAIVRFRKPIIAAVNGVAYAGGLEWACFADMRIAEEHASFGVTCRRWNIGLADGGTQRLPRIIGMGRAMELIITGKVIDAQEAYRIGLANEIVPKGTSLSRAIELAEFICTLPQPAIRTDKEAAVRGFGLPLKEGLRIEADLFLDSFFQPETMEGLKQFNERLHPDRRYDEKTKTPGIVRQNKNQ